MPFLNLNSSQRLIKLLNLCRQTAIGKTVFLSVRVGELIDSERSLIFGKG